jgi:hypothetical protein
MPRDVQCDPSLSCATLVEAYLYAISRPYMAGTNYVKDVSLRAICAGTSYDAEEGQVDTELKNVRIFHVATYLCYMQERWSQNCFWSVSSQW